MKTITNKAYALLFTGLAAIGAYGQENPRPKRFGKPLELVKCGTTEYEAELQKKDPKRAGSARFENWLAPKVAEARRERMQKDGDTEIITIPVVVHVIHNGDPIGQEENITDAQIQSQITVLNEDFRKLEGSNGFNNNPVGADVQVEFCLAKQDPNGLFTTGITRHNLGGQEGWDMEEVELIKPQTQWDPEKYLNIWVLDYMTIGGFLELAGYAQFPTGSGLDGLDDPSMPVTAATDGVAVGHLYFGSSQYYPEGTYAPDNHLGRTTTHEVGHYLGLRHIWGDGGCNVDDFCEDTPEAAAANNGCPANTDTCPDNPGNDMIENYMDYTNDTCRNIFTLDQKDRMHAVLANSPRRMSLATSPGCIPGLKLDNDGALNISGSVETCSNVFEPHINIVNMGNNTITAASIGYHFDDESQVVYNWTGTLASGDNTSITLPSSAFPSGEHTFAAEILSVNGVQDEAPANDNVSTPFSIVKAFDTQQIVITIQTDNSGNETLWMFMDQEENLIDTNIDINNIMNSDFYDDNELVTIPVDIPEEGCYMFGIIDLMANGICCANGEGYYKIETAEGELIAEGGEFGESDMVMFRIGTFAGTAQHAAFGEVTLYPNPAGSVLNIAVPQGAEMPETYMVYNSLGQVVSEGKMNASLQTLNISGYAQGVYFIRIAKGNESKTLQFIKQ